MMAPIQILRRKQRFADHAVHAHAFAKSQFPLNFDFPRDSSTLDTHAVPEITLQLYLRPLTLSFRAGYVLSSPNVETFRAFNAVSSSKFARSPFVRPCIHTAALFRSCQRSLHRPPSRPVPPAAANACRRRSTWTSALLGGGTGAAILTRNFLLLAVVRPRLTRYRSQYGLKGKL